MPTYAITGASGYLGTRMTRHLLEADPENRVLGLDVRPPRVTDPRLEFHTMDVRDPGMKDLLAGRDVRSLLHFAFVIDPFYDEREMHDIDLGGTKNVLEAARAAGVTHVVATSSTTAYGARPGARVPLLEDDPLCAAPDFAYAHDKRLMDGLLSSFARAHPEVRICTIRPCIILGPNVANYIAWTMLRQPVQALLDGADPLFQFVHEDDVVRLVALCVERQAVGAYNAVGEGMVTARELAALQHKPAWRVPYGLAYGLAWAVHRLRVLPHAMPPGILAYFRSSWVASGAKARRELGFEARHSTRECFEIIVARRAQVIEGFRVQMQARGKR